MSYRRLSNLASLALLGAAITLAGCPGDPNEPPPPANAPAAPTNLVATAMSSSRIDLTWTDASNDETGFTIERCAGTACADFAATANIGANVTTYADMGRQAGIAYGYRVRASNAAGSSAFSNTAIAVTLQGVPAAPSGLVATVMSPTRVDLTWTDNATNEQGFSIERCTGASCTNFAVIGSYTTPNHSSYADLTGQPSTAYSYRVLASNGTGSSQPSNIVGVTTQPATPPAAPSGLVATVTSSTSISLTWTDNSSNENGFTVERCQGGACTAFVAIGGTSVNGTVYPDNGLTAATTYRYRVKAYGVGESAYAGPVAATTQTVLTAPSGLTATVVSSSRIDLSWTDNSSNEDGFVLQRCTGAACTNFASLVSIGVNATSYSNTGLTASTSYSYRILAVQGATSSNYSNTAIGVTLSPLVAPTLNTPSVAGSSITLTWSYTWPGLASSSDRYELEESTTSTTTGFAAVHSPQTRTTPYTHTLTRGAGTYHYRVRAVTSEGTTPYSTVRSVTVAQASPVISVSVTSRTFTATANGANPASQQAQVGNAGGGTLSGLAVSESPAASWLTVSLSSTTAPATLTFQVTTGTLAAGTYSTTVNVTSPVANNSPQAVQVTFTVNPPQTARITVVNNLSGAGSQVMRFRVASTANALYNAANTSAERLSPDSYCGSLPGVSIDPGASMTFDVAGFAPNYRVYIGLGIWDNSDGGGGSTCWHKKNWAANPNSDLLYIYNDIAVSGHTGTMTFTLGYQGDTIVLRVGTTVIPFVVSMNQDPVR